MAKEHVPFKAGDVVALKSGGPPMTVVEVRDRLSCGAFDVRCYWAVDGGDAISDVVFPSEALRRVTKAELDDGEGWKRGEGSFQED